MRVSETILLLLLSILFLSPAPAETSRVSTSNTAIQPRIVGGQEARDGEFPYQLQILYNQEFICSGSLVTVKGKQVVITAAQCVSHDNDPGKYQLVAGNLEISYVSEHEQVRNVSNIFIHKKFRSFPLVNDIAVMGIYQVNEFNITSYVSPISLPRQGELITGSVIVSGWGNLGTYLEAPDTLQKVVVESLPDFLCLLFLSKYGVRPPSSTFCTGVGIFGGKGLCAGDTGGPVTSINGRYLAGIVSYNPTNKCGAAFQPSVNTKLSYFVKWIEHQVEMG